MNFHKNWKSFLNEGIKQLTEEELALIAEGRKDDAEKKYPQVNRFVDRLASLDPSPNNKYLMWMTKQLAAELDRQLKGPLGTNIAQSGDDEASPNPQDEFFVELFNHAIDIGLTVDEFHKGIQRVKNKDINSYKSLDDLRSVTKELGFSKRQKRKGEKMKALEDTEVLIENDYFVLARPYTVEAAAYLGGAKGATSWCIARGNCNVEDYDGREEWFTEYTGKGKSFYYIISKFLPKDHDSSLQALTITQQDVEAINNRDNKEIDHADFYENMKDVLAAGTVPDPEKTLDKVRNLYTDEDVPQDVQQLVKALVEDFGEEYGETIDDPNDAEEVTEVLDRIFDQAAHEILYAAREHEGENPAGPKPEDFEEALRDHEHTFEFVDIDLQDPDDWGGNRWLWNGYVAIDIPEDLDWVDTGDGDPRAVDYEDDLGDVFRDAMDDLGIYPDEVEVEISDYDEIIRVRFEPDYDEAEGINQFKTFLDRMAEYDGKYPQILEKAIEKLGEKGFIKSAVHDARKKIFDELAQFENLNKKLEKGVITIFSPQFDLPLEGLLKALNYDKLIDTREQHQVAQAEPSIVQKAFIDRYVARIEQNIRSPYTDFIRDFYDAVVNQFKSIENAQKRQLKLLETRDWSEIPRSNVIGRSAGDLAILNPDIKVSPSEGITGTIVMTIPIDDDLDVIQDKIKFAKYMDKYLKDCYKLLISQILGVALKAGEMAMEEQPRLFKPASGAQEDPSGWEPGMPTPEETMGAIDSVMEENKKATQKDLFNNWRKFLE